MKDHSNGSRGDRPRDRIQSLGASVYRVPPREELPDLIAQITRLWGELHLADPDLAQRTRAQIADRRNSPMRAARRRLNFEKPCLSARLLRIGAPAPVFAFLRFRAGV